MKSAILKPHFSAALKLLAAAALMLLALASARAQTPDGRVRLESLERVASKASETVNIDIDGILLKLGKSMLDDNDPDEKTVKEIIEGLRGVYVRSYEFKTEGEFKDADLDALRQQLRGPGWSRLVDVKTHGIDFDGAEVYALTAAGRVEGMAVLISEPKHLMVINVVGSIDLDKLKRLEGTLGIPRIHIGRGERSKGKRN
ncbi:MAG TPA: DUF4252 domain-containing protein [Pyrinomonadaceae bacterium]|jgi:hypothetical protein|nr:DUF4252 domain-containing protein [Pyrinomonadaceae bacterium]